MSFRTSDTVDLEEKRSNQGLDTNTILDACRGLEAGPLFAWQTGLADAGRHALPARPEDHFSRMPTDAHPLHPVLIHNAQRLQTQRVGPGDLMPDRSTRVWDSGWTGGWHTRVRAACFSDAWLRVAVAAAFLVTWIEHIRPPTPSRLVT